MKINLTLSSFSLNRRSVVLYSSLVGVLIFVTLLPPVDPTDDHTVLEPLPSALSETEVKTVSLQSATTSVANRTEWPEVDLNQIVLTNPFAPISANRRSPEKVELDEAIAEASSDSQQPNSLSRIKAGVIFGNERERIALMGSRVVRVGDKIAEGQIVEITTEEVVLSSGGLSNHDQ